MALPVLIRAIDMRPLPAVLAATAATALTQPVLALECADIAELATDEMKRKREKMEERSYKRRTRTTTDTLTDTTKYHCKDCDSNECAYADLKGHRDIRKNETWGSNESADDARVMVVCKQCGAEWNETVL